LRRSKLARWLLAASAVHDHAVRSMSTPRGIEARIRHLVDLGHARRRRILAAVERIRYPG
jgi:hypothetical protein